MIGRLEHRLGCPRRLGQLVLTLACAILPALPAAGQTLEEALATSYTTNPNLLAARAQLRSVNEGVPQELSNWRPRVTVNGSAGAQRFETDGPDRSDSEDTNPREIELSVIQSLYRGGRTQAGTARAEAEVRAQRARLTATEQQVLLDAVTAYMDVWRDQSVLELNLKNEQVIRRQLEASQDRFTVGEITRTDVAQSEARLSRATAERIQADGALASSRAVYQQVIGVYPGILKQPPTLGGLPDQQQMVVDAALAQSPDVVSAQFVERAARHQVRQDIGELLPEVSLVGDVARREERIGEDLDSDEYRILAEVTIPLYQQGLVSSQVREDKQVANQRRLEVDSARRIAEQNAIRAWEALQTSRAEISSFSAGIAANTIALEGVRQENAVGARTILDILDAEQELLDSEVSLVRAQRDELVASYAVFSAMGILTAGNLKIPVELYDPEKDYKAVRNKWFGLGIPGE
jgi:TolC family type I secretion outer membrane protein